MSAFGRRYAKALLDLAREGGEVDAILQDAGALFDAWKQSAELREILQHPVIPKPALKSVMDALMDKLGSAKLLRNTVYLLGDKGRLGHLDEVLKALEDLAEAETGRIRVEVTSAKPMSESYYDRLVETLQGVMDRKIVLVRKQDPSLIAGVVTRIGDRVFDGSVSNQLHELKETLLTDGESP